MISDTMMPTPLCHVASLRYNFKTFFSSTIRLSSVFNLRLPSIDSFASMSAPRSSVVKFLSSIDAMITTS